MSFRVALAGHGVRASLTPAMHLREAAHLGIGYGYDVVDLQETGGTVDDAEQILRDQETAGYDAANITYPLKQAVLPYLDDLEKSAEVLGAVNLVRFADGRRMGANTDVTGFRDAFTAGLPEAELGSVVQLGAGGAGSATAYALLALGTRRLSIVDTDPERASALAERSARLFPDAAVEAIGFEQRDSELHDADGVLNATPIGMLIYPGVPADVGALNLSAWVADVVYRPVRTEFIVGAQDRGHPTLDGGGMAVGQAADSIRLITGREPDRARMRAHFLELVRAEEARADDTAS
jgi:shikimate dehydrogenase